MPVPSSNRWLHRGLTFVALLQACSSWSSAQPTLQITSPAAGATFSPGQTVTVTVSTSGSGFSSVLIVGQGVLGFSAPISAPPYKFSVAIPALAVQQQYTITAVGVVGPDQFVSSPPVSITVQRPDAPVSVRVEPDILELKVGEKGYLRVIAAYRDGSTADVTQAPNTAYKSNSIATATVNSYGIVTAVAPGSATILVKGVTLVPLTVARR